MGALTGLCFGLMSKEAKFQASWEEKIVGFLLGGIVTGLIIGTMLPLMRFRWLAGIVVGFAASCGLIVGFHFLHESIGVPNTIFLGACFGLMYSVLLWDYRAIGA
jgi:hypothetical protein